MSTCSVKSTRLYYPATCNPLLMPVPETSLDIKKAKALFPQPNNNPTPSNTYILREDYAYVWEKDGEYHRIVVLKGFVYDGTSVPRFAWTISGITPDGPERAASLVHDALYVLKGNLDQPGNIIAEQYTWNPEQEGWEDARDYRWTRKEADRLFGRMLREIGVPKIRRRLAFLAVHLLGWTRWRKGDTRMEYRLRPTDA